jgi:hypothetical protein
VRFQWKAVAVWLMVCALHGCSITADPEPGGEDAATRDPSGSEWAADTAREASLLARDARERGGEEPEASEPAGKAAHVSGSGPSPDSACTGEPPGSAGYCSNSCPCTENQGDCDHDAQCSAGLVCMRDTGGLFGMDPRMDTCMEQCAIEAVGTPDFCSPDCPCEAGQGDCDDHKDCAAGNVCAKNVGASFGFDSKVDVCVDTCDAIFNGTSDYCSPSCPCEHGQGDCDGDEDCAPGHVCVMDVGASYGFDPEVDVCVSVSQDFAGRVINDRGNAVAGAEVSIDGSSTETGEDGSFALRGGAGGRHVINVTKNGYVPLSRVHVGGGVTDLVLIMSKAEVIAFAPSQPVDVEDSKGTRLVLGANALVDENGEPPKGPVTVQMHTYDLMEEEMVGNMEAVDENGQEVVLQSVGAVSANFMGANGQRYQLAPGQTAQIAVELPDEIEYSGPIPMWYYDEEQGHWIEEGMGMVQDGVAYGAVSHFSVWNFDVKFTTPACIRVVVPAGLVPPGATVQARVVVPLPFPRMMSVDLESGDNVLFNLPPDTEVQIFVPADAATPLATVNTGASWGGTGVPPAPYTVCNGSLTLPTTLPGQLMGTATLQGRRVHSGITVQVRDSGGTVVATTVTDELGLYTLTVDSGSYTVELSHPGHLRVIGTATVLGGKVIVLLCVHLAGGDVNGDDSIDNIDLDAVLAAMGSSAGAGEPLDVNGDGMIDSKDQGLVQGNLGLAGPLNAGTTESQCASGEGGKIVAGGSHTCAVQDSGAVRCWGYNRNGQLGYGHTRNIGDDETLLSAPNVAVGGPVCDLAAGYLHTCALMEAGTVRCWGTNALGSLGYGSFLVIGDDETPATAGDVPVGSQVVQLASGQSHVCALLDTGAVRCWGWNLFGELGYGHTNRIGDNETPASAGDVNVGGRVVQLVAGGYHTCALLDTGAVRCWGYNDVGQLGYGHTREIGDDEWPSSAGDVDVGGRVVQLAAGHTHTCAVLDTRAVRCWGYNGIGQLGYGHTSYIGDNETPASAGDVNVGGPVTQIVAGSDHTCARLDTGAVRCWGSGYYGALGYGNMSSIGDNESPASAGDVPLSGIAGQITAGHSHVCAQLDTGGAHCWGQNSAGELGVNTRASPS